MSISIASIPFLHKSFELVIFHEPKAGSILFDYQNCFNANHPKFVLFNSTKIYKQGDQFKKIDLDNSISHNDLITVTQKGLVHELTFKHQSYLDPYPFLIVNELVDLKGQQGQYRIKIGDLIRIGKIDYHVSEMRTVEQKRYQAATYYSKCMNISLTLKTYQCKFCYMEEQQNEENPFLEGICKCQGNINAVHLECLKFWIDQNITKEETHFGVILKWKKAFECQVCKEALPMRIRIKNKIVELFNLLRPDFGYFILEVQIISNQNIFLANSQGEEELQRNLFNTLVFDRFNQDCKLFQFIYLSQGQNIEL